MVNTGYMLCIFNVCVDSLFFFLKLDELDKINIIFKLAMKQLF